MNISNKEIQKFAEKTASSLGFTTSNAIKGFVKKLNINISYFFIGADSKYNKSFIKIDKANKKIEIRLSNYTTKLRNNFTITWTSSPFNSFKTYRI